MGAMFGDEFSHFSPGRSVECNRPEPKKSFSRLQQRSSSSKKTMLASERFSQARKNSWNVGSLGWENLEIGSVPVFGRMPANPFS